MLLMHIDWHPIRLFPLTIYTFFKHSFFMEKHVSSQVVYEVPIMPRHDAHAPIMFQICLCQINDDSVLNIRTDEC